jgi:hypothetical protein
MINVLNKYDWSVNMRKRIIDLIKYHIPSFQIKFLKITNLNKNYKTGLISFFAIDKTGLKMEGKQLFRYDQAIRIL